MAQARHDPVVSLMSMAVHLREALATDEAFVLRLEELALRRSVERAGGWFVPRAGMGDGFPENCRIVQPGGHDVGCLTLTKGKECIHVDQFYVLPEHQRKGVGRGVLSLVLSNAAQHGQRVTTTIPVCRETLSFFTEQGFALVFKTSKSAFLEWSGQSEHANISETTND